MNRIRIVTLVLPLTLLATPAGATVVRFETVLGDFDIRLFDAATPQTAQNLLAYVNGELYDGSFIHRSAPAFVIQGGGFTYDPNTNTAPDISPFPSPPNEPGISNIRGTLAMAKQGGNPNSATSEWFHNLSHNTDNLDFQNGGFTVFAAILGNGLQVSDAIAALPRFDLDPPPLETFDNVPLRNGTGLADSLVFVTKVYVLDIPDGDYNLDGTVNGEDLAVWETDYSRLKFVGGDFNDDKEMNSSDLAIWESNYGNVGNSARYTNGDSNGDFVIDGIDFLNWQRGAGGTTDVAADGDGDAQISGLDFLMWQQNHGAMVSPPIASVPEPAAVLLLLLGFLAKPQVWGRACRR